MRMQRRMVGEGSVGPPTEPDASGDADEEDEIEEEVDETLSGWCMVDDIRDGGGGAGEAGSSGVALTQDVGRVELGNDDVDQDEPLGEHQWLEGLVFNMDMGAGSAQSMQPMSYDQYEIVVDLWREYAYQMGMAVLMAMAVQMVVKPEA